MASLQELAEHQRKQAKKTRLANSTPPKLPKKTKPKEKVEKPVIECLSCGKFKEKTNFYAATNKAFEQYGAIPYCKNCLKAMCANTEGDLDRRKTLETFRMIDKPFILSIWNKTIEKEGIGGIGKYLRELGFTYRNSGWLDGELENLSEEEQNINPSIAHMDYVTPAKTEVQKFKEFVVTDEIMKIFGTGFTDEEYFHMWNKYNFLKEHYTESTSMHREALVTYIRYKVKEEMAIAADKPQDAKTWGELAMKQAERAKINPNQFSKADLQGGLSTIGDIAQAVEENVDIIPVLPQFKYRPNDAVDFCIWNYINYARDLEGKPAVDYSEIYAFYDKAKKEYIESTGDPNGIFENDPTIKNRDKIKNFINLPEDYDEEGDK